MDKVLAQGFFEKSSVQLHKLNEKVVLSDGDIFRYVKVGGSTVSQAKLQQAPAAVANHVNQTGSAVVGALGAFQVTINVAGTAVTQDQYKDGYFITNDATGEGYTYRISGNEAIGSNGSGKVFLKDPLQVALVASTSEYTLVANPSNGVVEVASAVRKPIGIAVVGGTTGQFIWVKSRGIMGTLIGVAATVGANLISDGSTAGAVTDNTDVTTVQTEVVVGHADFLVGVATEENPISVTID